MELAHVSQQRVLVREEHLGPGVVGPRQVAEHEVEPGGALRHVSEHPVQPGQLPVHLGGVAGARSLGQRDQVSEDVREDQPGQLRVLKAGGQHVLDRAVGPVPGLGELVDVVPVAVLGQVRGASAVVGAVEHLPFGQRVKHRLDVTGGPGFRMLTRERVQRGPRVGHVHQHLVIGPCPVEGA